MRTVHVEKWAGLIVGQHAVKERGDMIAVVFDQPEQAGGVLLCIVGTAVDPVSYADAQLIAKLWNDNWHAAHPNGVTA